jgi:methyltransferase-like protein/SAM-dependent methyltransferase
MIPFPVQNCYDEVLYLNLPFEQTHPGRLELMATLFGMNSASARNCRVLEVGCGDGGNLIPMACNLPASGFVGIDLAEVPIKKGEELIQALGLKNILLRRADLSGPPADLGVFDYIIAHGVYSWVSPSVQEKLLALIQQCLAPQGVAYVSYNTYPGWHLHQMSREMMLFHTYHCDDWNVKVREGINLINFLATSQEENNEYGLLLKKEYDRIASLRPGHLFHDDLEEFNIPVYFHQFIEHAGRHQLQFLAEAEFPDMQFWGLPAKAKELLARASSNPMLQQQYLDFLRGREFRQTLLCHSVVQLDRNISTEKIRSWHLYSPVAWSLVKSDTYERGLDKFIEEKKAKLVGVWQRIRSVLIDLQTVYPQTRLVEDFVTSLMEGVDFQFLDEDVPPMMDRDTIYSILLDLWAARILQFRLEPLPCVLNVSRKPEISRLVRYQLSQGKQVTTQLHTPLAISSPFDQMWLQLLDGTRDRAQVLAAIHDLLETGRLALPSSFQPKLDNQEIMKKIETEFDSNLARIAKMGLMVG